MGAVLFLKLDSGQPDFPGEWLVVEGRTRYIRSLAENRKSIPARAGSLKKLLGSLGVPGIVVWPGMTLEDVRTAWQVMRREFRAMGLKAPLNERMLRSQRELESALDLWVIRHLRRRPPGWRSQDVEGRLELLPGILGRLIRRTPRPRKLPYLTVAAGWTGRTERSTRDIRDLIARASALVRDAEHEELAALMERVAATLPDERGHPSAQRRHFDGNARVQRR